jgi:cytochrome c oxidase subunit 4
MTSPAQTRSSSQYASLAHVVSVRVLLTVFVFLMVLTVVTVSATWIDLGAWNLWVAMAIASVKASLVALYFMHLRYDRLFHALIFVTGLVILTLFLSLTMLDTVQYQPSIELWQKTQQK